MLKLATSKEGRDYRAEAKAWASVLHDAEARKAAEEAAELILRKGFELPTLTEIRQKKTRMGIAVAQYREPVSFKLGMGKIEVNTHPDVKRMGGYSWDPSSGWSAQSNVILHEFGHMVDHYMEYLFPKTSKEFSHDRVNDLTKEEIKKTVSEYATWKTVEFKAEVISSILAGKTYPKKFLEAADLDRYLSDERGKTIFEMGSGAVPNTSMLEKQFGSMMEALFHEEGASLRIELLDHPEVAKFTESHARVLNNSFIQVEMSDTMRARLRESDYIFSGIKTFHELNEAFPSLLDKNGNRKPFNQFLNDVQKIDRTYNKAYLSAEYNHAQAAAEMAAKWEDFEKSGDDYNLQYRTAGDDKVRPEHAALHGVTLPMSDPFWDEYYPPNGWNCRCTVVQVLKDKYPTTDRTEAYQRGKEALAKDTKGIFHFNPGKQEKTFPDYNPYTLSKCNNCSKKLNLAKGIADSELCEACLLVRARAKDSVSHAAERIATYKEEQWEHTHISERADGFVVTEHGRIAESKVNKHEKAKFEKELSMCKAIADNGHDVEFLHGVDRPLGQTFDIRIDGVPADLKYIEEGGGGIPKYTKHAFRDQGANIVVFRLPSHDLYGKLREAHRKYGSEGRIYFYFADDTRLREIKK